MVRQPRSPFITLALGLVLLLVARSWSSDAAFVPGPAQGQPAPDFSLPGRTEVLSLSHFKGQVVLLDFWASWCSPCAQSFPWLESLQQKYQEQGFTVLGVCVDKDRKKADAFLARHKVSFPVVFDPKGQAAAAYALPGMPSSYIVDRAGVLRRSHTGFRPEECAELEAFVRGLLAEAPTPSVAAPAGEGK